MANLDDILHTLIDVVTGRRNLPAAEADELHELITPGYGQQPVTDDELAQAQAVIDRANAQRDQAPSQPAAAPATPVAPAPAAPPNPTVSASGDL